MATATQGISVRLVNDPSPESPRMWDNLGTMVCAHRRYNLGDESGRSDALSIIREHLSDKQLREMDFDESHVPDIEQALELTGQVVMLPLYLYLHSGMSMKTSPFSCSWDSGKVGFIFVSKEKLTQEYGWKRLTADRRNKIHALLEGEVEDYDTYLRGDVWGFEVVQESQVVDSCWGFFGSDPLTNGVLGHLSGPARELVESGRFERSYA
jgi:hypothetical protein